MRTILVLFGFAVLVGGCTHVTELVGGPEHPRFYPSKGDSRLINAKYRAIISVKRPVIGHDGQPLLDRKGAPVTSLSVCAEPSPDALQSLVSSGKEFSAEHSGTLIKLLDERSERSEYVGLRTQTIQLLRDAYFRLCEAFLNDGIDAITYDVLQRRFQSQVVALLAVEQLTGAATAQQVSGKGTTASNAVTELALITKVLEESEQKLLQLQNEKAETDNKKNEKAQRTKATIEKQIELRQHLIRVLRESFAKATQPVGRAGASVSPALDVANAVRAITLNAINQDYESQVCFETLRYHNNLGQFRNDVNYAFDSSGMRARLAGDEFLNHCRRLFASLADFRDARVGVVEAYTSAIDKITHSAVHEGNISPGEAAELIKVLTEAVPTEPGVAFLPPKSQMDPNILRNDNDSAQQ